MTERERMAVEFTDCPYCMVAANHSCHDVSYRKRRPHKARLNVLKAGFPDIWAATKPQTKG